jgi:NADH-quinone oxidoreductase subunit L
VIGVFITSLYSFRLYLIVFHGNENWRVPKSKHYHGLGSSQSPHESSWVVTLPLILLAIPSVVIGFFTITPILTTDFLSNTVWVGETHLALAHVVEHFHGPVGMALHGVFTLPFWLMIFGFATAYCIYYKKYNWVKLPRMIKKIMDEKYGFDRFNELIIAPSILKLGRFLWNFIDMKLIDNGLVNGAARLVNSFSLVTKKIQTGYVSHYAFGMAMALIAFISYFVMIWL